MSEARIALERAFELFRKENGDWNKSNDFLENCKDDEKLEKVGHHIFYGSPLKKLVKTINLKKLKNNGELFEALKVQAGKAMVANRVYKAMLAAEPI